MTLATKGTFNLWSQSFPTMKRFTVNGPVFLHLCDDVINDHQERYLPVHVPICTFKYARSNEKSKVCVIEKYLYL